MKVSPETAIEVSKKVAKALCLLDELGSLAVEIVQTYGVPDDICSFFTEIADDCGHNVTEIAANLSLAIFEDVADEDVDSEPIIAADTSDGYNIYKN